MHVSLVREVHLAFGLIPQLMWYLGTPMHPLRTKYMEACQYHRAKYVVISAEAAIVLVGKDVVDSKT